jgi:hypothetical protein
MATASPTTHRYGSVIRWHPDLPMSVHANLCVRTHLRGLAATTHVIAATSWVNGLVGAGTLRRCPSSLVTRGYTAKAHLLVLVYASPSCMSNLCGGLPAMCAHHLSV